MTAKSTPPDTFLTVNVVAETLHKDPKTVRRWIKAGKLAAVRLDGSYLIDQKDLDLFLRDRWTGRSALSGDVQ